MRRDYVIGALAALGIAVALAIGCEAEGCQPIAPAAVPIAPAVVVAVDMPMVAVEVRARRHVRHSKCCRQQMRHNRRMERRVVVEVVRVRRVRGCCR